VEQRLTELWYSETAGPPLLLRGLSFVYAAVTQARRSAYANGWLRSHRAGKPVVVVGNLTVGGTGKTPLVAWLAEQLSARRLAVGIVSRGYGRAGEGIPRIVEPDSDWRDVGDEPLLLRRRTGCDTIVARDRLAGTQALVARGADVIVADDGLQHLRLARDCEVVVIDGTRGFGNGRLLPAGPLREPLSRLLRADVAVVNGAAEHISLVRGERPVQATALQMSLVASDACRLDDQESPRPLESFRGRRVHAVAGIGNPARFFRDLRAKGIDVVEHAFDDHHPYVARDLDFSDELPVLMTEKDAVKCRAFANPRLWHVPVVARFSEAHACELLEHVVRKIELSSSTGG
jgi:tetraacyldisaccharide 4'-kinase